MTDDPPAIRDIKILYTIGQLRRGGAEQQFFYLIKHLNPTATIVVFERNLTDAHWVEPLQQLGHRVIPLERRGRFDLNRVVRLARLVRAERPDIIHLFTDTQSGLYGRLAAILAGHRRVIVGERRYPALDPGWYSRLKRWGLNRPVSLFVANARSTCDYLIEHDKVEPDKVKYIPNGIDLDSFVLDDSQRSRAFLPDDWQDKIIVGSVGSLLPKKAPEVFVRLAHNITQRHADVRFVHVGKGPLFDAATALTRELGIADRVLFLGERFDIPQLLHGMDIFVMTSRNEGTPNAAMEAMAAKLPCVVTDTGDCRHLVADGDTGFVVPVDDVEQLTDRVSRLVGDPALRQRMGQRGFDVIQGYDVHSMAEQYRLLYLDILARS